MTDTRELCEKAVAELRNHGGFPALADFLEATMRPPVISLPSEPEPAPAVDQAYAPGMEPDPAADQAASLQQEPSQA